MKIPPKIDESFNQEFCDYLEYHLSKIFRNSSDKAIRKLWCDGIIFGTFSKKEVNCKREINTTAWIGEDGQGEYEMKIKFGKYSLRRYAKGASMIDSIPDSNLAEWIDIDIENNQIELQLK